MKDYRGCPIEIGNTIKNIESGWYGVVVGVDDDGMLVCHGRNWWTMEIEPDDKQWHAPADVIRVMPRQQQSDPPNPANFL